jgi:hypothetical protein
VLEFVEEAFDEIAFAKDTLTAPTLFLLMAQYNGQTGVPIDRGVPRFFQPSDRGEAAVRLPCPFPSDPLNSRSKKIGRLDHQYIRWRDRRQCEWADSERPVFRIIPTQRQYQHWRVIRSRLLEGVHCRRDSHSHLRARPSLSIFQCPLCPRMRPFAATPRSDASCH